MDLRYKLEADATKAGSGAYTSDDYSTYTLTGGVGVRYNCCWSGFLLHN
jgi:hypothetical protein